MLIWIHLLPAFSYYFLLNNLLLVFPWASPYDSKQASWLSRLSVSRTEIGVYTQKELCPQTSFRTGKQWYKPFRTSQVLIMLLYIVGLYICMRDWWRDRDKQKTGYATSIGISTSSDIVNGLTLNHPLFLALYPGDITVLEKSVSLQRYLVFIGFKAASLACCMLCPKQGS